MGKTPLANAGDAIGQAGQREGAAAEEEANSPMLVRPSGRLVSAREGHPWKAKSPMLVSAAERVTWLSETQSMKAPRPMRVRAAAPEISTSVRERQPEKASEGIFVQGRQGSGKDELMHGAAIKKA